MLDTFDPKHTPSFLPPVRAARSPHDQEHYPMTEQVTEQNTDTTVAELPKHETETVELDSPITRGKQTITEIQVRKPKSGALRGVTLNDVLNMDVQALTTVLPRITEPALTAGELRDMDPADLVQFGSVVSNFLLPRRLKAEAAAEA